MYILFISPYQNSAAITWLEYCRYGVKPKIINQSKQCVRQNSKYLELFTFLSWWSWGQTVAVNCTSDPDTVHPLTPWYTPHLSPLQTALMTRVFHQVTQGLPASCQENGRGPCHKSGRPQLKQALKICELQPCKNFKLCLMLYLITITNQRMKIIYKVNVIVNTLKITYAYLYFKHRYHEPLFFFRHNVLNVTF